VLGRSYKRRVPLCNKSVLTKKRLTAKEKEELAIILNETEELILDEELKLSLEYPYFNKFYEKIQNIKLFLKNREDFFREEINNSPYFNIIYDTFFSFCMIASKSKSKSKYWVSNKRRAYKTFLDSLSRIENSSCYIVNPIFDSYIYLFNDYSPKLINHNIECARKGLKIEQIFIAKRDYKINDFTQEMIKKLEDNGITVRFALLEDIEKIPKLKSYDFLYSNSLESVGLYRSVDDYKYLYNVIVSPITILKLKATYKKIKKISLPLQSFLEYQNKIEDPLIEKLYGVWYHYSYGSIKEKNEPKIWEEKLEIEKNGDVFYMEENGKIILKGKLNISFSLKDAFIYLIEPDSQNIILIKFNKDEVYKGIFRAPILDNSFQEDINMISFGFFSKKKLDIKVVKEILGEERKSVLIEDKKLQDRINNFLRKI